MEDNVSGNKIYEHNCKIHKSKLQKASEDIFSDLKINTVVKKIYNYLNKWVAHIRRVDRDLQTATFNYEMSTMWETKQRTTTLKTFQLFVGLEQVTWAKML
jgi:hypothetical protein